MGENQWREEDDWPLARAQETKYFLHSAGKANSLGGNGTLSTSAPAQREPSDQYVYDPANPVPTVGGPLCCDSNTGARAARPARVEARDDVLVYSTPPLAQDTEVTGPVSVELFAKSSAVDTDFTAKLVDVWPDGFAQNLTEGILRARYRDSQETPTLITPGQVYKFNIDRLVDQQRLQKRTHAAPRNFQQQFSPLRPQPEHRAQPLSEGQRRYELGAAIQAGDKCDLSRCGTSVGADSAGCFRPLDRRELSKLRHDLRNPNFRPYSERI